MNSTLPAHWYTCSFISRNAVGSSYLLIKLLPTVDFKFTSGQYVKICLEGDESTAMYLSIASSPKDRTSLDFCLLAEGQHPVLQALKSAQSGQTFWVSQPMGTFVIVDHHRPMQFIAGGSGIAPIRSFLKDFSPSVVKQSVRLIYGCRSSEAIPYLEELRLMARQYHQFELSLVVEQGAMTGISSGNVLDILSQKNDLIQYDHYLCGARPMVEAVKKHLLIQGVDNTSIYFDG